MIVALATGGSWHGRLGKQDIFSIIFQCSFAHVLLSSVCLYVFDCTNVLTSRKHYIIVSILHYRKYILGGDLFCLMGGLIPGRLELIPGRLNDE